LLFVSRAVLNDWLSLVRDDAAVIGADARPVLGDKLDVGLIDADLARLGSVVGPVVHRGSGQP